MHPKAYGSGFGVQGLGLGVLGFESRVLGAGFGSRVLGQGFWVKGFGSRVLSQGFWVKGFG